MKTKNILIPFEGFYESIASQKCEDIAFSDYISEKGIKENKEGRLDIPDDMTTKEQEDFWDNYYPEHIKDIREGVVKDYIRYFNDELGINASFESIDSPMYYNFTTDRLFVDILEEELISLYNKTDKTILADMIKDKHTSRSGFDSYYDNDINDESWKDITEYDHNQWLTVIDAYIKERDIDLSELYYI